MPFAASLSTLSDTEAAIGQACDDLKTRLKGQTPDLVFFFTSHDHAEKQEALGAEIVRRTGAKQLLGCTAETVVGGNQEVEQGSALALWGAVLAGRELVPFHIEFERTPDGLMCLGLPELEESSHPITGVFLLGEPFSCAVDAFIQRLDEDLPGAQLMGGMASGAEGPGKNSLYLGERRLQSGGVGLVVRGGTPIRAVVSQGCRPIGGTLIVTKAQQNVILELGGKPALVRLKEVFGQLNEKDRELIQSGLHVGVVMDEYKGTFERGDFLISNVLGADTQSGAIAIGNLVRVGQTVQFHVRDAETADEDLRQLLSEVPQRFSTAPQAALLFSCNGRGTRLFPKPNHDVGVIQELCGPVPLAGFFAQGELGPVGGRNHIHGFTASVALFTD